MQDAGAVAKWNQQQPAAAVAARRQVFLNFLGQAEVPSLGVSFFGWTPPKKRKKARTQVVVFPFLGFPFRIHKQGVTLDKETPDLVWVV